MQIDEVHRLILEGLNKTQVGYLSHEELDDFFNRAQRAEFAFLLAQAPYAKIRKVHRDLSPFRVAASTASSSTGYVTTPAEMEYLISVNTSDGTPVDIKTESQIGHARSSSLAPPTTTYPACEERADGFQMWPKQTWNVEYYYLATPTDVQYVYSLSGRTVTYDDVNSVHPQWKGAALERVINRAIELGAEYLQTQYVDQKMQQKTERGS